MNVFKKMKQDKQAATKKDISKPKTVTNKIAVKNTNTHTDLVGSLEKISLSSNIQKSSLVKQENSVVSTKPKVFISNNKGVKTTTIAGYVRDKNNPNKGELHAYQVKKTSAEQPNFNFNEDQPLPTTLKGNKTSPLDPQMKDLFVDTLKKNKLTEGTRIMMDNEVVHAKEAIESGIYVTWGSKNVSYL